MLKNFMHYNCLCGSGKKFKSCCSNNKKKLNCINFLIHLLEDFNKSAKEYADECWHSNREGVKKLLSPAFDMLDQINNPTAIILGAGNCRDLPLKQLVEKCSYVELVDIDYSAIKKARATLPEDLQKKVKCTWLDITGLYHTIVPDIFDHILNARLNEALWMLRANIDNPKPMKSPITKKFDLSVSINVVSQLIGLNFNIMTRDSETMHNNEFQMLSTESINMILKDAQILSNTVITLQHMELLHKITKPTGLAIVSSDKFSWGWDVITRSPVTDLIDSPEEMLVPTVQQMLIEKNLDIMGSTIDKHYHGLFSPKKHLQWLWHFNEDKTFLVDGYVLSPKR